jgi:phosphoglycolate phosphatase-like HAD superfamily hydrolase
LYIDLDGPVLDVSRRYHEAYRTIVSGMGETPVEREVYWRLKRIGWRETEICARMHPGIDRDRYLDLFVSRIEEPGVLAADLLAEGAGRTLAALKGRHRLVLATLRRRGAPMRAQLAGLGILDFFDGILQTEANHGSWRTKATMIAGDLQSHPVDSLLVGDTEGDILAARSVRIRALGVRNGLRDPGLLAAAGPCTLIDTIEGLIGHCAEVLGTNGSQASMGERSCARW